MTKLLNFRKSNLKIITSHKNMWPIQNILPHGKKQQKKEKKKELILDLILRKLT